MTITSFPPRAVDADFNFLAGLASSTNAAALATLPLVGCGAAAAGDDGLDEDAALRR